VNPSTQRGPVSQRGRERRVSVKLLVVVAVGVAVVLMATLTAQAVVARTTCNNHPLLINVAASEDISPAIQRVGQLFNRQSHEVDGRCVEVQVTEAPPAAVAGQVDGQASSHGLPAVDAWVPDSSLWVNVARAFPLGAQRVQTTGITVARSPLMIVMPAPAAAQVPSFNNTVGWNFLLPGSVGGPPAALGLRVDLPDPTQSATGLASLVEMSRLLGNSAAARTSLTKLAFTIQPTAQFSTTASLAAFSVQALPPLSARPVTVTSEQAVLGYDAAHPHQPLAAQYPVGPSSALGTQELNYPYVVTSTSPAKQQAARQFGDTLRQSFTASVVRFYGFRSANGVGNKIPAADGIAQQPMTLAQPATPGEAQTVLQAWNKLQIGSRDLTLIDASAAMATPSGVGSLTLEQAMAQTANLGLALFPDSAQIGLWEMADKVNGNLPYKQLVSVGPLPAKLGLISRRQQLVQIDSSLRPLPNTPLALNQSILAAYKQMSATYQPKATNAVIVMTAGVGTAPGDLPTATLVSQLRKLYNPARPVELIIVVLGTKANFTALQQVATAGGGAAYQVTSPDQIGRVFFQAVSRRICQAGACTAAP
jgi:Ca-activated chloride channel homolog